MPHIGRFSVQVVVTQMSTDIEGSGMVGKSGLFRLVSFNGSKSAPKDVEDYENYWRLIGELGNVLEADRPYGVDEDRVLLRFQLCLDDLGLENHNEIPNSLWIRLSDLAAVAPSES
jgi:hypothetical protein